MHKNRLAFVGAAIVATAALTMLSISPAQGDPGNQKEEVATDSAAIDSSQAPDAAAGKAAAGRAVSNNALLLLALQRRIANFVAFNGSKYTFGTYLDPTTGRIIFDSDAPFDIINALLNALGTPLAASSAISLRQVTSTDAWSRRDDIPAYYGGGGIASGGTVCSSGYTVKISTGAKLMITAGHCYNNGATVKTESGNSLYGLVFSRRLPTFNGSATDMEVLAGSYYAGRIFTGGVNSSTSIPVVSAGPAYVGYNNYCTSGRTTGETCGHTAVSTVAQVCTATGCKFPVIAYTGGTIAQAGDSGAPFYAKDASGAWIRGHVIARTPSTGYIEPYTVVASTLGVSIVTSA